MNEPWETPAVHQWLGWLCAGYRQATGTDLVPASDVRLVYDAAMVVVSHRCADDPCFVYANRAAQAAWGYSWERFVGLPSRLSAPPEERSARQARLQDGLTQGAVRIRDAIRIRADGRRFRVDEILLWNVSDDHGAVVGQAATYSRFTLCG